ncbi:fibronectin type III domain-containing protein [Treponema pectinovorum]|uniref:fibronectin type III domain-containing protein n=1 Tax=Treponema pectinovorum TaxID=164 RepID=UPI001FE2CB70|nr:fibronectin type III domain-containing protein [Treponema pectinovorum]
MKKFSFARILAYFALCFSTTFFVYAQEKTIILGGQNGWKNISSFSGVTTGKGQFGFESLQLESKMAGIDENTDLLLSFDSGVIKEDTGRYDILENHLVLTDKSIKGKGAALSRGVSKGITLQGNKNSVFGSAGLASSFIVEFYLAPSLSENGEKIYSWRSSMNYSNYSEFQNITAVFNNNKLEWKFKNVFPSYKKSEVILKGYNAVVPGEWKRHTISFDEETGCLEYLVDGKTEDIKYITSTGHEGGAVCMPVLGAHSVLEICPAYTGRIDHIRIVRSSYEKNGEDIFENGNAHFKTSGGRFVSEPLFLERTSTLKSIDSIMSVPSETDVKFYVRAGDNCYCWTEDEPKWQEVTIGEKIEGVTGSYFQIAGELFPDGNGLKTPSITELTLTYTQLELPLPPFYVDAQAGDRSVTLTWNYSVDDSAGGYYVYYGNRPGEYLGRVATQGLSPINAGNTTSLTLTGLENDKIYYFAIVSYSRFDERLRGEFSKEVFARPSKR